MKPLLEKYKNNELSDAERDALEEQMMTQLFEKNARKEWDEKLKSDGINRSQPQLSASKSGAGQWRWVMVAASIALIALVGSQFLFSPTPPVSGGNMAILDRFVDAREVKYGTRMGEQPNESWTRATQAFNAGNYPQTIAQINNIANPTNEQQFYRGIAQFYLKDFGAAANSFQAIVNTNGQLSTESKWYLALAQLKSNQVEAAKIQLAQIAAAQDYKATEAQQLLEELKKTK